MNKEDKKDLIRCIKNAEIVISEIIEKLSSIEILPRFELNETRYAGRIKIFLESIRSINHLVERGSCNSIRGIRHYLSKIKKNYLLKKELDIACDAIKSDFFKKQIGCSSQIEFLHEKGIHNSFQIHLFEALIDSVIGSLWVYLHVPKIISDEKFGYYLNTKMMGALSEGFYKIKINRKRISRLKCQLPTVMELNKEEEKYKKS